MKWNPIETAPKDGTPILTESEYENYSVRWWGEGEDGIMAWQPRTRGVFPRLWMEIPKVKDATGAIAIEAERDALKVENAKVVAVLGQVKQLWPDLSIAIVPDGEHDAEISAKWNAMNALLTDIPDVLAVVDIPTESTTVVVASDPVERAVVIAEHVGGGTVLVLAKSGVLSGDTGDSGQD